MIMCQWLSYFYLFIKLILNQQQKMYNNNNICNILSNLQEIKMQTTSTKKEKNLKKIINVITQLFVSNKFFNYI